MMASARARYDVDASSRRGDDLGGDDAMLGATHTDKHAHVTAFRPAEVYGYSSSQSNLPHRYGNPRAIWFTQCYLPPDIPAFTPTDAGTRLSDPGGMQG